MTSKKLPLPIRPPSPNYCSTMDPDSPVYSLFNSVYQFDWLPSIKETRKHSVAVDNSDFVVKDNNHADFWRRASLPNYTSYTMECALCYVDTQFSQSTPMSCEHHICQLCLSKVVCSSCPLCMSIQFNSVSLATELIHFNRLQSIVCNTTGSSYPPIPHPAYLNEASITPYYCVKVSNISWDISQHDIKAFFKNCTLPSSSIHSQSIHIMMDRLTGKTYSECYVEFPSELEARKAIKFGNQKFLKGRITTVSLCSSDELLKVIFPKWKGKFINNKAVPFVQYRDRSAIGQAYPPFVTREEINSLLVICKNYKLHFSRKCAERPFENIISIITKYPWNQIEYISTLHRDHIYEMLKLAIETLKIHLSKETSQIDSTLLERAVRAGVMCPSFTERQKTTLLQTAKLNCPEDIKHLLFTLEENIFMDLGGTNPSALLTILNTSQSTLDDTIYPVSQVSYSSSRSNYDPEESLPSMHNDNTSCPSPSSLSSLSTLCVTESLLSGFENKSNYCTSFC
ncbi:hypothetical protein BDB01DRAFT_898224 [Pilobolus umbonatus]|nr:hypothetical protein BDB01DRAFT_898224 [Pilobolus umbonatus]